MPRIQLSGNLKQFFSDDPEYIAIDTETYGVRFHDEPFYASVAWRGEGEIRSLCFAMPKNNAWLLRCIAGRHWVFHNAKFDLQKLILAGIITRDDCDFEMIEDTEALASLINENQKKNLKELARRYLNESTDEETELRRIRRRLKLRKSDGYNKIPSLTLVPYALKDAEFTIRLYEMFSASLDAELQPLYRREIELTLVLLDMETNGLGVDLVYLRNTVRANNDRLLIIDKEIERLVGRPVQEGLTKNKDSVFNPQSTSQILAVFEARGLKIDGTDKTVLSGLSSRDPLAGLLLERRHLKKINSTYLETILDESKREAVFHGNFRQHGTRTRRLSSGGAEA